jgi:hypothetical protein
MMTVRREPSDVDWIGWTVIVIASLWPAWVTTA